MDKPRHFFQLKIINKTKNNVISQNVVIADSFLSRMVGLLNRKSLKGDESLVITRCNSIHMFFMRFTIDVIFVSKKNQVVGIVKRIKPFQLSPVFFKASYAVEFREGMIAQKDISIGDVIEVA